MDESFEFQVRLANEVSQRRVKDFYETCELINYDVFPVVTQEEYEAINNEQFQLNHEDSFQVKLLEKLRQKQS